MIRRGVGGFEDVGRAAGLGPVDVPPGTRVLEAGYAPNWLGTITSAIFG